MKKAILLILVLLLTFFTIVGLVKWYHICVDHRREREQPNIELSDLERTFIDAGLSVELSVKAYNGIASDVTATLRFRTKADGILDTYTAEVHIPAYRFVMVYATLEANPNVGETTYYEVVILSQRKEL